MGLALITLPKIVQRDNDYPEKFYLLAAFGFTGSLPNCALQEVITVAFLRRRNTESNIQPDLISTEPKPHDVLCERAVKFLKNNGFSVAFNDRFRAWSNEGELPDAIGFRNGVSCIIEVKCSRADFLVDKKKRFRIEPSKGMGDWRFFMCEPGIIERKDLPEGWGLLYIDGRKVIKVYRWPGNAEWLSQKPFIANKQAECDYLYSALRRVQI